MITTGIMVDMTANAAFQQARHQNNFFYAQEMLRSDADTNASEKLQQVQQAFNDIKSKFDAAPGKNERIQILQDVLAMHQLYFTPAQIEAHFLDAKNELKPGLVSPTPDDHAWGELAFDIMKEALKGYTGKDVKKAGKTRDEYVKLDADLNSNKLDPAIAKAKSKNSRNDLWAAVKDGCDLDGFAKKVNLNQKKMDAHRKYLDAGFFALAENKWWHDDTNAAVAASQFRKQVLVGKDYNKPQCYMRATSTPRRGEFQGATGASNTRRVVFKNPPWSMGELAKLFNGATHATFNASMVDETPPVSTLNGAANPFHNVVFQLSGTWYIMGGKVDSADNLILQKVELQVDIATGKPLQDINGTYFKKQSTASTDIISMFSASEMTRAKNDAGARMDINKLVEDGLATLIGQCGYGLSADSTKPSEEQIVEVTANPGKTPDAEVEEHVYFVMDDTLLLRQWLLQPGVDLKKVFGDPLPAGFAKAVNDAHSEPNIAKKDETLANLYQHLHEHPDIYKVLADNAAKADPNDDAMNKFAARAANKAAFKALPNKADKEACRAVVLGDVLAKLLEAGQVIAAMPDDPKKKTAESALHNELHTMLANEKDVFDTNLMLKTGLSLDARLNEIVGHLDKAMNDAGPSTLFVAQRAQLQAAVASYKANPVAFKATGASLLAANPVLIPNTSPYTAAEQCAVRAIACADVIDQVVAGANITDAIKNQNGILDPISFSGADDVVLQAVITEMEKNVQALKSLYPAQFAQQCTAIEIEILPACKKVKDVADLRANPPADKDFKNAELRSVEKEIVARKFNNNPDVAVGFVRRADASDVVVVEAASSGADYLNGGWNKYVNKNPGVPLALNVNGKNLQIEQCAPPLKNAIPGKAYFRVMDVDAKAEYMPKGSERAELQKALSDALMKSADKKAVIVAPNKNQLNAAEVTTVGGSAPSVAPSAAPASAPAAPINHTPTRHGFKK